MWAQTNDLAPLAVFVASLAGSAHCVGMCGPFTLLLPRNALAETLYHLGRLLSYALLGALAGLLGKGFLHSLPLHAAQWTATLLMSLSFLISGVTLLWRGSLHLPPVPGLTHLYTKVGALPAAAKGLSLGAVSVLLPCGWLYGFVIGAVATGHPVKGAVFLSAFWLGTVPALFASRALIRFAPKYVALFLILVGLLMISIRMVSTNHHHSFIFDQQSDYRHARLEIRAPSGIRPIQIKVWSA